MVTCFKYRCTTYTILQSLYISTPSPHNTIVHLASPSLPTWCSSLSADIQYTPSPPTWCCSLSVHTPSPPLWRCSLSVDTTSPPTHGTPACLQVYTPSPPTWRSSLSVDTNSPSYLVLQPVCRYSLTPYLVLQPACSLLPMRRLQSADTGYHSNPTAHFRLGITQTSIK